MGVPLDVVVGLGANLGDRLGALRGAVDALSAKADVVAVSPVYETAPMGPAQPPFLNAAVRVTWPGSPRALLDEALGIERAFGRVRAEKWGPRTLDLDILWVRGLVVDEEGLKVPHPGLLQRAFALRPLLDVAPDARDPRSGALLRELGADILEAPPPPSVSLRAAT